MYFMIAEHLSSQVKMDFELDRTNLIVANLKFILYIPAHVLDIPEDNESSQSQLLSADSIPGLPANLHSFPYSPSLFPLSLLAVHHFVCSLI